MLITLKPRQLPLGFFATFFGMNNLEINGATWMTLNEQIRYMCESTNMNCPNTPQQARKLTEPPIKLQSRLVNHRNRLVRLAGLQRLVTSRPELRLLGTIGHARRVDRFP